MAGDGADAQAVHLDEAFLSAGDGEFSVDRFHFSIAGIIRKDGAAEGDELDGPLPFLVGEVSVCVGAFDLAAEVGLGDGFANTNGHEVLDEDIERLLKREACFDIARGDGIARRCEFGELHGITGDAEEA